MIRVALFGAAGRMGRAVVQALADEQDIELAWAIEAPANTGEHLGSITTVEDTPGNDWDADVWVDVTLAEAAMEHARAAERFGRPILIGATGFSPDQARELEALTNAHIVAPNLSVGVNLLFDLAPKIRRILGDRYDVGVIDTHHKHKVDAPSGTAKKLVEGLNREGPEVQVVSLRVGEVVGEHKIVFAVDGEQIELTHRAESRLAFARGVAPAVRFLAGKTSGSYSMADVLGLDRGANRT